MKFYLNTVLLLLLTFHFVTAQKIKKADKTVVANLHQHIEYLASDKLEGRRTGTNGEKLAMEYISDQFKSIGLVPKGTENYYQPFDVNDGKQMSPSSELRINNSQLVANKDFFVFPFFRKFPAILPYFLRVFLLRYKDRLFYWR